MDELNINRKKENKIFETIFIIAIATIFILVGIYYIPWIIFLYPIFFIVLGGVRNGIIYNLIGLTISSLSLGLMIDRISGIFILLTFAPLSIVLNYIIEKKEENLLKVLRFLPLYYCFHFYW